MSGFSKWSAFFIALSSSLLSFEIKKRPVFWLVSSKFHLSVEFLCTVELLNT